MPCFGTVGGFVARGVGAPSDCLLFRFMGCGHAFPSGYTPSLVVEAETTLLFLAGTLDLDLDLDLVSVSAPERDRAGRGVADRIVAISGLGTRWGPNSSSVISSFRLPWLGVVVLVTTVPANDRDGWERTGRLSRSGVSSLPPLTGSSPFPTYCRLLDGWKSCIIAVAIDGMESDEEIVEN